MSQLLRRHGRLKPSFDPGRGLESMNWIKKWSTAALAALVAGALLGVACAHADGFRVYSHDIKNGQFQQDQVLSQAYGLGCNGGNLSPHINWEGMPQGTQSFVLSVVDLDANNGKGWTHWVVINIPYAVDSLPRGAAGDGAVEAVGAMQLRNDFGEASYNGPCPPAGQTHRYQVTLTALKIRQLPVDQNATLAMLVSAIDANKIESVAFIAVYGR
jgi:Raf kinase inhibitor-like YbhB/YbcL family protein